VSGVDCSKVAGKVARNRLLGGERSHEVGGSVLLGAHGVDVGVVGEARFTVTERVRRIHRVPTAIAIAPAAKAGRSLISRPPALWISRDRGEHEQICCSVPVTIHVGTAAAAKRSCRSPAVAHPVRCLRGNPSTTHHQHNTRCEQQQCGSTEWGNLETSLGQRERFRSSV